MMNIEKGINFEEEIAHIDPFDANFVDGNDRFPGRYGAILCINAML